MAKAIVRVPATAANLGPGFDVLGLALKLYNRVEVESGVEKRGKGKKRNANRVKIEIKGKGEKVLPKDKTNIVYKAVKSVFQELDYIPFNLRIKLINEIPLARGLGSSAAARLGGIVAANILCGRQLDDKEILLMATKLEGHPDNVVPAKFGGLVVTCNQIIGKKRKKSKKYTTKDIEWVKLNIPNDLYAVICYPEYKVFTDKARKILPKKVSFDDAVFTSSRVATLIAAIIGKQYNLIGLAMDDKLHQPYRSRKRLVPGMKDVIKAAKSAGALGAALCGSGSGIIALAHKKQGRWRVEGKKIGKAMKNAFAKKGKRSKYLVLEIDMEGTREI